MKIAPINRIIPFSNVDGPGNRTSIFFQGCTFQCLFCHNPETIHLCCHCGECVHHCPVKALKIVEDRVIWSAKTCVQCDTCLHVCPHSASPRVRWMTVEEVYQELQRSLPYIDGITTSGGECTLYPDFLRELFSLVRPLGITCLIDSNGSLDFQAHPDLLAVCDGVMLDVKAWQEDWSWTLLSHSREIVLQNLRYLLKEGKLQEVRTLIFPNRDQENWETVSQTASVIQDACPYKIIRYRPFGVREANQKILGEFTTEEDYAASYAALARHLGASQAYVV